MMKKIFALALLLGLGMLVGCGPEEKPKGTAKPTVASGSGAAPAPAADTAKK
jgi:hypothetical protein